MVDEIETLLFAQEERYEKRRLFFIKILFKQTRFVHLGTLLLHILIDLFPTISSIAEDILLLVHLTRINVLILLVLDRLIAIFGFFHLSLLCHI